MSESSKGGDEEQSSIWSSSIAVASIRNVSPPVDVTSPDKNTNEKEVISPSHTTNKQPPALDTSMHSSGPSIVFPVKQPVASNNYNNMSAAAANHNRNVTPHTESLMNLFARPAQTPLTPQTPQISTDYGNNSIAISKRTLNVIQSMSDETEDNNNQNINWGPPLMPHTFSPSGSPQKKTEETYSPSPNTLKRQITPTTNNTLNIVDIGKVNQLNLPLSFVHRPKVEERFHSESTQITHNRDETMVAHNLRRKSKPYYDNHDDDQSYNERSGLIQSTTNTRNDTNNNNTKLIQLTKQQLSKSCDPEHIKPTLIGAFLFSLYQLVFCFAEASAITRPSHSSSNPSALLSPMALMACMGSLISAPMLIAVLGGDYPALYPCLDMFMAPFLGQMAADIDEVLVGLQQQDGNEERSSDTDDDTSIFLATFVALNAFGMLFSGVLCVLAGKVKLANLAGFLPYPVLCGFFSSVGISIWMSAFKVDTGMTIQHAIALGDGMRLLKNFARHAPSFVAGSALYRLGPRGPHFMLGIIASTVGLAYLTMLLSGTSLDEAQDMSFFWKKEEVMMDKSLDFTYGPPSAFGLWSPQVVGMICWPAFKKGLPGVIAMSVIYLLRCSLHAAALNKCTAKMKTNNAVESHPLSYTNGDNKATHAMEQGHAKPKRSKPKDLMIWYASSLFAVAFSGGFAVLPAIALGGIFSKIGASDRSPQYCAMILLLGCYLSDFALAAYVPKCTFSSLLVLASIDLIHSWFIKSYEKSAMEWIAVPFIVITSLAYGMLQSVALGLGASTLIFVASFQRAGVVKFIANGLTIRSTIERNGDDNEWLDQHADMIQILVLQNFLFFGNANSILKYVESMFEDEDISDPNLPPIPKFLILDLSIMTGIDTSAVDVLADISALCKEHKCSIIFAGVSRIVKPALITGGVNPSKANKHLSFSPDLECALGKAEDALLKFVGHNEEKITKVGDELRHHRQMSMVDHGLRHALHEIDLQHNLVFSNHLTPLEKYTTPIEVRVGDKLNDAGCENNLPRGLYFVEAGLLKCEHDSSATFTRGTRGRQSSTLSTLFAAPHLSSSQDSIGQLQARSATVGSVANVLKNTPGAIAAQQQTFRLARIGPGWIIGSISEFSKQDIPGTYTALTPCRVHHLTFETIEELEIEQPVLILHLYKLLSHLASRRQEMTIGQLATLRSIMSATAPTRPISRTKMRSIIQSF